MSDVALDGILDQTVNQNTFEVFSKFYSFLAWQGYESPKTRSILDNVCFILNVKIWLFLHQLFVALYCDPQVRNVTTSMWARLSISEVEFLQCQKVFSFVSTHQLFPSSFTSVHKVFHDFAFGWLFQKLSATWPPLAGGTEDCNGAIIPWQSRRLQEWKRDVFLICLQERTRYRTASSSSPVPSSQSCKCVCKLCWKEPSPKIVT